MPKYLSNVALDVSTDNFYWGSRLLGALADHSYAECIQHIERHQDAVATRGRRLILEDARRMAASGDFSLAAEANEALADMARKQTIDTLNKVLLESSRDMKNGYNRKDN
jgi:dipeptidase